MTVTNEGVDTGLESLVDFDLEVPCDAHVKCGLAAKWVATTACCGDRLLLCDEHHEALLSVIEKKVLTQCGRCDSIGTFNIMILSIERL